MADARFYDNQGPFALGDLAKAVGAPLGERADAAFQVHDVSAVADAGSRTIGYLTSLKAAAGLDLSLAGAWVTTAALAERLGLADRNTILHENPAAAFAQIANRYYPMAGRNAGAGQGALVDASARIGDGVTMEPGVVIGPGAEIGNGTHLAAYALVGRGVSIGRNAYVGPHASMMYTLAGDRVTVMAGARIGNDGFGFVPTPKGLVKVPQIGRVILQDDVEVGANSTIDRGALGDTVIGEGTRLDNSVHVAHNCTLGRFVVVAAQVGIAGSTEIGDGVLFGGQVGVGDHVTIGAGAQFAAKSGVAKSLPGGQAYGGVPARPIMQWRRESAALSRLVKGTRAKNHE